METQDVSTEFLYKLWPWLEANKGRLISGAVVIVLVVGIYSFVSWRQEQKGIAAGQAYTRLVAAPKKNDNSSQLSAAFAQLAVKYAGTAAAQRAQLQAAATLFEAGNYADAQTQFQKFLNTTPAGPLAATASLGVAASLEAQDKLAAAAGAYEKVTSGFPNSPAELQAEFALGRLDEQSGKLAEAENYYMSAARLGRAGGSIAQEAEGRAYEIKARLAAMQTTNAAARPATNVVPVLKKILK